MEGIENQVQFWGDAGDRTLFFSFTASGFTNKLATLLASRQGVKPRLSVLETEVLS